MRRERLGEALSTLGSLEGNVPWWRVVKSEGEIPTVDPQLDPIGRLRLESEGIRPSATTGKILSEQYGCLLPAPKKER